MGVGWGTHGHCRGAGSAGWWLGEGAEERIRLCHVPSLACGETEDLGVPGVWGSRPRCTTSNPPYITREVGCGGGGMGSGGGAYGRCRAGWGLTGPSVPCPVAGLQRSGGSRCAWGGGLGEWGGGGGSGPRSPASKPTSHGRWVGWGWGAYGHCRGRRRGGGGEMIHLCHVPLLADRKVQDFDVYGVCGGPDRDRRPAVNLRHARGRGRWVKVGCLWAFWGGVCGWVGGWGVIHLCHVKLLAGRKAEDLGVSVFVCVCVSCVGGGGGGVRSQIHYQKA